MLSVPGANLFTLEIGDGPEPAVVLHGGPGASHDYLRPQLDAIAQPGNRRVFYYDQRGGGRSALNAGTPPAPWREHVADLERIRLHLGREQLVLVGYSWGGLLALLYASQHPERVARLALISPAPAWAQARDQMRERLAAAAARPEVIAFKQSLDLSDRRNRFAVAVAGYFFDPRRALELTPFLVRQPAEAAVWQSLGAYDLRPALSRLTLPALVVHGREDPIPIESARETARLLSAEWLEFERCGHVPYLEAPNRLIPALTRFLDS